MGKLELAPGDILFTANPGGVLGPLINRAQRRKSLDGEAVYGHAGIIAGPDGKTIEARWKIGCYDLRESYRGQQISIHRIDGMNFRNFWFGLSDIRKFIGKRYPWWRLPLHLVGLGKSHLIQVPVCSELVVHFIRGAMAQKPWIGLFRNPWGWTPDNLYDQLKYFDHAEPVYEGMLC
jgi:hypothetical protein